MGLIGTGRIGQVHAASISELPETTLQRVADIDAASAASTAERFGCYSSSPDEIFSAGDVDAVLIASPTVTHLDLMVMSVHAGIPVLCEKPIDLDITRVDAVRDTVTSAEVPVALGFNRRFDPHFQEFRRRVLSGEIGILIWRGFLWATSFRCPPRDITSSAKKSRASVIMTPPRSRCEARATNWY
jgi:myo-inositol 2-dehydrogenase/D-chiro-inositol 1-dehydrogenase